MRVSGLTKPAGPEELKWVWPAACSAHLFDTYEGLEGAWRAAPWSVRVTKGGEAAIVDRWRSRLDILAVRGLWCSMSRIPVMTEDLCAVAAEQGFARLLGPLVPESEAAPYLACGMDVAQRIVVLRLDRLERRARPVSPAPVGVGVRRATPSDAAAVLKVDEASFDEFWAYDTPMLAEYLRRDRVAVATRNGQVVGYTLATMRGEEGSIGRLAVIPAERRRGIGAALLDDAVAWTTGQGASHVTLCTQEENAQSQRLYRAAGFREVPGRLVGTISVSLDPGAPQGGGSL